MEVRAVERADRARSGPERGKVTGAAANLHEHLFTGDRVVRDRSPRRRREHGHEVGEGLDVAAVVVHGGRGIEIERQAVALWTGLVAEQRVGDADLVEQRVAGKL